MSNLLQPLGAESSSHSGRGLGGPSSSSAAAALGIPHEVRLKLAKRMRQEQLRLYHEREAGLEETRELRCKDGGFSEAQDGEEEEKEGKKKKKGRMVAFGAKELILDAAQKSDREEVLRMLSENLACPNTTSKATGSSLLHLCSLNNDLPSLQVLLEHGADVNIQDYDLWTPLHVAAACGHTSIAEALLEYDADTTLLDVDGNFAYDSADNDDLKELLLKHMSFKGIYEQDLRSLRSRQAKAMLAAVKDCVSRNKNLNLLNKNGVALLHIAAANGYYKIAKLLLDGGADVSVNDDLGYTPLHVAAKFEQLKVVKLLLKRSADPNAKSGQLELPVVIGKTVQYRIGAVADRDENSKLDDVTWGSFFKRGTLTLHADKTVSVKWDKEIVSLTSHISEKGRGVELSELIVFNGKLYTIDDRSGIVYQIRNNKLVPWVIMEDGPGNVDKGFKAEWMTVKDQRLYIGGLGKEWTTQDGIFVNDHPQYIKIINTLGHIEHLPWASVYNKVKKSAGINPPGYIIHEAVVWSDVHRKWFFLPRRASRESYNDVEDEHRATNLMITADEAFVDINVSTIGPLNRLRGFSSFKFLPETHDSIIVALKSEESKGTIATYMYAFDLENHVLMAETKIADTKYEGIEFI